MTNEETAQAIKKYMASRRREQRKDVRQYPVWHPTMTTRRYVALFQHQNKLIDEGHAEAAPNTVPAVLASE